MQETTYCIIDCRVSDPQQLKGGSLEDQEMAGRMKAEELGATVAMVFRKPHSATTTERDDFEEVKAYIKASKKRISFYIIKSIDRFTRAGYTEYLRLKDELEELGVTVVDCNGVIQPKINTLRHLGDFEYKWSMKAASESAEMLAAHESNSEVTKILTRLVGAEIKLVQEGYCVRWAPDGLQNKAILVDGKNKKIREPDPDRAHFFKKMFELLASGMDYPQVVEKLNAMGFRTREFNRWDRTDKEHPRVIGKTGGNRLTVKQLQRYVLQTEYAGVIYEKWTKHRPVKAKWDGIVSIETYNKANRGKRYIEVNADGTIEVFHNYSPWGRVRRMKNNPEFPWKVILCPTCNAELLGSSSRGKSGETFAAYHCGGNKSGKRSHPYFRVRKSEFDTNIKVYLESLRFETGFLEGLEEKLIKKYRQREKDIVQESSLISRNVADLKAEQANKLEAYALAESATVRRMLETQIDELESQIKDVESKRTQIELTEKSIKGFIRYAKKIMEHPAEILTSSDDLESRRALMSLFFEVSPTYMDIVNGTPKLQPLFRLSEDFKQDKSPLVTLPGIEPGLTH